SDGQFLYRDGNTLAWKAPEQSGHYSLKVKNKNSNSDNSQITLNIFVLHPYSEKENGYIDNFKIGDYPEIPADKKDSYKKPKGFLKIEESMLDIKLTPHFKLEQFLTNQSEELPHYVVIKESLLLKLEYLLAEFNKSGYAADTFGIVSIYRTPYFNKEIGNNTNHSRHIYGDAADIYIDSSGDGQMDDLNNDGKVDINDANVMLDIAVKFDKSTKYSELVGGVCSYKSNCSRGPFIHIDTRGSHVTW
ncbi:MAG: peptidase M15A, partial [Halanaerobiales bacterium]